MASKKGSSAAQKNRYKAYELECRGEKNKVRKLERHLKRHPNDKQTVAALKNPTISGAKRSLGKGVFMNIDKGGKKHFAGGKLNFEQKTKLMIQRTESKAANVKLTDKKVVRGKKSKRSKGGLDGGK